MVGRLGLGRAWDTILQQAVPTFLLGVAPSPGFNLTIINSHSKVDIALLNLGTELVMAAPLLAGMGQVVDSGQVISRVPAISSLKTTTTHHTIKANMPSNKPANQNHF
jgi:hypothetical protein